MVYYEAYLSPYLACASTVYIGRYGGKKKVPARGPNGVGINLVRDKLPPPRFYPRRQSLSRIFTVSSLAASTRASRILCIATLDLPDAVIERGLLDGDNALVEGHAAQVVDCEAA